MGRPKKVVWTPILPVPDDIETPSPVHPDLGTPLRVWYFYNEESALLGLSCSFTQVKVKTNQYYLYASNDQGEKSWQWFTAFPKPMPLFNLDLLKSQPDADVWIVHDEADAEALTHIFPEAVPTTWPGREVDCKNADWRILKGRKVYLWPVSSEAGKTAGDWVWKEVKTLAAELYRFTPPENAPDWNVADAVRENKTAEDIKRGVTKLQTPDVKPQTPSVPPPEPSNFPFRCLGYDHGDFFYQPKEQNQVIRLAAAAHSKGNLLTLAPLLWWETCFPGPRGCSWDAAADCLIRAQEHVGPYDHNRCRGRGVWWDAGKPVMHLGDRIRSDGKDIPIKEFGTKYIYESRPSLEESIVDPMTTKEANVFFQLCALPTWERPVHGRYLAGWCVISTICGGLEWRPSIWLTGPSGSGKTWINERMVQPILGPMRLYALGKSTEAGLRQALQSDALPIVLEEAEQDDRDQDRHIQGILTLMRQSSSETGAKIYRGTMSGQALEYCIRSSFCFSSIGVGAKHHADQSRVTVLTLVEGRGERFEERFITMKKIIMEQINAEYGIRFRARAFRLLPVIRQNASTFSDAVATLLHSKRLGDQVGVLLAGAYSLCSEKIITPEEAKTWVESQNWDEEQAQEDTKDETSCLHSILQIPVRINDGNKCSDKQIVELVAEIAGEGPGQVSPTVADEHLRRCGVRVDMEESYVYFSNASAMIQKALKDTAWQSGYSRLLRRLKGAEPVTRMRFTGFSTRCVRIPLAHVLNGKEPTDGNIEQPSLQYDESDIGQN